jgi:hypothetical protein
MSKQESTCLYFSFYPRAVDEAFNGCLESSDEARFSISFPLIACQFMDCTHPLCPEEVSNKIGVYS